MARFIITVTIDDDEVETLDDLSDLIHQAWADDTSKPRLSVEGTRSGGGRVEFVFNVDTTSFGIKAV